MHETDLELVMTLQKLARETNNPARQERFLNALKHYQEAAMMSRGGDQKRSEYWALEAATRRREYRRLASLRPVED